MSFSSRVIAEPAPPVSPLIKGLGLAIWAFPILLSSFVILVSPRSDDAIAREMTLRPDGPRMGVAFAELPNLREPEIFERVSVTAYIRTPLNLPVSGEAVFPLAAEAWKPSPFTAGKIALKVDHDRSLMLAQPGEMNPARLVAARIQHAGIEAADIQQALQSRKVQFAPSRSFRHAKVLGATAIIADNLKIVLANIEPLPQEAVCTRIDGVVQNCLERAEHRLAILLQARSITCELSEPQENGLHLGRCMADKIDIASDLLRQRLAHRRAMTLASNNP